MVSRRAVLLSVARLGTAAALSACGSSEQAATAPAQMPSYAGKGETTAFDGAWLGSGYSSWRFDVKDGVFTAVGEGKGLSSWTGAMSGYIRKDHTIEGVAYSGSDPTLRTVGGTWPRLAIYWSDSDSQSVVRLTRL
jgi:hypothetical protein